MADYLGEQAIKVIVSPGRAGYLVPEGDQAAFERAVTLASSRWTGVTEPILALRDDGTLSAAHIQIAQLLDLVGLVNVHCGEVATSGAIGLGLPIVHEAVLDGSMDLRSLPSHVGITSATDYVGARPDGDLWEKVAAGVDTSNGHRWAAASDDNAGRASLARRSLLEAALAGFAESETINAASGPILLWVTKPDSLADCLDFWNYRAMRGLRWPSSPTFLVPEHAFGPWVGIENSITSMIRERRFAGRPDLVINSHSVDDDRLRDIGQRLNLTWQSVDALELTSVVGFTSPSPRDEYFFTTDLDPRAWLAYDRTLGYDEWFRVQVFRERTAVPVLPQSLRPVLQNHAGIPLRLRMSGGFLDELPRTPSTARSVLNTAAWSGPHLQSIVGISSNGLLNIDAPSARRVLELVVQDLTGQVSLSDKGRLAASLVKRHDVSVIEFKDRIAAIQALTTRRSKELVRELGRLDNPPSTQVVDLVSSLGGRVERNYRSARHLGARGLPTVAAVDVLESLADAGWVERGFKVDCDSCAMSGFVPVPEAPKSTTCPACGATSKLVRSDWGVDVYYRLDAFADRCSDQGVLTHAAVASVLLSQHPFSELHLGADVEWAPGNCQEVDLLGFLGPRLVAGEIKTSGNDFTDEQIDRDVALSARLGVDCHVMAYIWPPERPDVIAHAQSQCTAAGLGLLVVRPAANGQLAVETVA